jgi:hypothetical protein
MCSEGPPDCESVQTSLGAEESLKPIVEEDGCWGGCLAAAECGSDLPN